MIPFTTINFKYISSGRQTDLLIKTSKFYLYLYIRTDLRKIIVKSNLKMIYGLTPVARWRIERY